MAKIAMLTLITLGILFFDSEKVESFGFMFIQKANSRLSGSCTSLENIQAASKVGCAMICAQQSGCNSANFRVLESECQLNNCDKISNDTIEEKENFIALFRSRLSAIILKKLNFILSSI